MQITELKEYIKNIYQLEVSLYNQNALMVEIKNKIQLLSHIENQPFQHEVSEDQSGFIFSGVIVAAEVAGSIGLIYIIINFFKKYKSFEAFLFSLLRWVGIPFVIIICIYLILAYLNYDDAKNRNSQIRRRNQWIKETNEKNRSIAEKKITTYNIILKREEQLFLETKNLLKKYYNDDVIFPKYRYLIPISSFYEYLISGRCDCLEGHEGAYNIYENELRQNIIIGKLDDVIQRLDQIERTQYMLYSAIKEGNKKIDRLTDDVNKTVNSLHNIDNSTAFTAYNSEIIAQNTEFLTWIEIYRENK